MRIKNFFKTSILLVLNIFCFILHKKRAAILLYHSVDKNDVFLTLDPEIFEKQMKYLKSENYKVIKLKELVDDMKNKKTKYKTVVLTFDDGFLSHYKNIFPILKKYDFPASFFVSTGCLDGEMGNCENKPQPTLNWKELGEMNESKLIDIEPHGITHAELDNMEIEKVKDEIIGSKKEIEKKLKKRCDFFAYPRGKNNDKVIDIVKAAGFKSAVTTASGIVNIGDNMFKLKRNTVDSSCGNMIQFKARLNRSIEIFNKILGHEY